jgi:hypothetical protein
VREGMRSRFLSCLAGWRLYLHDFLRSGLADKGIKVAIIVAAKGGLLSTPSTDLREREAVSAFETLNILELAK